jgi:hypothetical protein
MADVVDEDIPLGRALDEVRFLDAAQRATMNNHARRRFEDSNDKGAEVMVRVRIKQAIETLARVADAMDAAKQDAEERLGFLREIEAHDEAEREAAVIKLLTEDIVKTRDQSAQIARLA